MARDKKRQREWTKEHYDKVTGFRPICKFDVLCTDLQSHIQVSPNDFIYGGRTNKPFRIWGSPFVEVHVPRSLLRRCKIMVDKRTREIKASSKIS